VTSRAAIRTRPRGAHTRGSVETKTATTGVPTAAARWLIPLSFPMSNRETNLEEARGTEWLLLERRGQEEVQPELVFLGGRVKTRVDKKFVLYCMDSRTGQVVWKAREERGEAGRRKS
jgi:hypothetical protein